MLSWLRRFFTGGEAPTRADDRGEDSIVRVRAALHEPEAEMWRTLLENSGVPAMVKNVGTGAYYDVGRGSMLSPDYDLFVRRSDLERAEEILSPGAGERSHDGGLDNEGY